DHAHDPEDEGEADAHQPVDASDQDAGAQGLQELLDEDVHARGLTTSRPSARPSSMTRCASRASASANASPSTGFTSPRRRSSRHWRSSSRVVLVALSIDTLFRNSCAGLKETKSPVSCPTS